MNERNTAALSEELLCAEQKEKRLQERLERIQAMEAELKEKERALKAKESAKKSILLRLPPSLHNQIAAWAEEDFRSINGQIEYLLTQAVSRKHHS